MFYILLVFLISAKQTSYYNLDKNLRKMKLKTNPKVNEVFTNYPENVREKMQHLRTLVIETAKEEGINELEETLK